MIRLLTIQHEEIINKLGELRRATEIGVIPASRQQALELVELLAIHNRLEEDGLFDALNPDEEFAESLAKLRTEHFEIDGLLGRFIAGDVSVMAELETVLRNNISNEENGLFPASAVTLDGGVWDQIELEQGITS